jgi:hypothetical protein
LCFYALDPHNVLTPCYSSFANHFTKPEHKHLICADGDMDRSYAIDDVNKLIQTQADRLGSAEYYGSRTLPAVLVRLAQVGH